MRKKCLIYSKVPNGGLFTTANDLARFAMALSADTDVLAKNYRDTMQTIQTPGSKSMAMALASW